MSEDAYSTAEKRKQCTVCTYPPQQNRSQCTVCIQYTPYSYSMIPSSAAEAASY